MGRREEGDHTNMRKLIMLVLAALLTSVGVAGATSRDQGRRLAGPFCIGKTTVSPLRVKNTFGQIVVVPRAGIVRSIGLGQKCNANENRRFGVPVRGGGAGPKGDAGPIGPQGPAGPAGANGANGAKGDMGPTGADGAEGPAGADGAQGLQGETGPAGPTGAMGSQGPAGATGPQGPKGDAGATGAQGPKGDAGATGAQGPAGPKGDTGPTGPAGPQGPAGAAGLNGSSIVTVAGGTASGDKQFTVSCPAGDFALSGGFDIQGSVTASYRSSSTGDATGTTAWTIRQSSGAALSGTVYVYCVASS
jgi:Collagen triple helix repeat (20 copies)